LPPVGSVKFLNFLQPVLGRWSRRPTSLRLWASPVGHLEPWRAIHLQGLERTFSSLLCCGRGYRLLTVPPIDLSLCAPPRHGRMRGVVHEGREGTRFRGPEVDLHRIAEIRRSGEWFCQGQSLPLPGSFALFVCFVDPHRMVPAEGVSQMGNCSKVSKVRTDPCSDPCTNQTSNVGIPDGQSYPSNKTRPWRPGSWGTV
jgi:hypothetical protein